MEENEYESQNLKSLENKLREESRALRFLTRYLKNLDSNNPNIDELENSRHQLFDHIPNLTSEEKQMFDDISDQNINQIVSLLCAKLDVKPSSYNNLKNKIKERTGINKTKLSELRVDKKNRTQFEDTKKQLQEPYSLHTIPTLAAIIAAKKQNMSGVLKNQEILLTRSLPNPDLNSFSRLLNDIASLDNKALTSNQRIQTIVRTTGPEENLIHSLYVDFEFDADGNPSFYVNSFFGSDESLIYFQNRIKSDIRKSYPDAIIVTAATKFHQQNDNNNCTNFGTKSVAELRKENVHEQIRNNLNNFTPDKDDPNTYSFDRTNMPDFFVKQLRSTQSLKTLASEELRVKTVKEGKTLGEYVDKSIGTDELASMNPASVAQQKIARFLDKQWDEYEVDISKHGLENVDADKLIDIVTLIGYWDLHRYLNTYDEETREHIGQWFKAIIRSEMFHIPKEKQDELIKMLDDSNIEYKEVKRNLYINQKRDQYSQQGLDFLDTIDPKTLSTITENLSGKHYLDNLESKNELDQTLESIYETYRDNPVEDGVTILIDKKETTVPKKVAAIHDTIRDAYAGKISYNDAKQKVARLSNKAPHRKFFRDSLRNQAVPKSKDEENINVGTSHVSKKIS